MWQIIPSLDLQVCWRTKCFLWTCELILDCPLGYNEQTVEKKSVNGQCLPSRVGEYICLQLEDVILSFKNYHSDSWHRLRLMGCKSLTAQWDDGLVYLLKDMAKAILLMIWFSLLHRSLVTLCFRSVFQNVYTAIKGELHYTKPRHMDN